MQNIYIASNRFELVTSTHGVYKDWYKISKYLSIKY